MNKFTKVMLSILLLFVLFLPSTIGAKNKINEEMMYKILLDRYNVGEQQKSDSVDIDDPYAYHGGDLKGLKAKLGFIEGLGYSSIAVSSIMANKEDGYHGYWIEDFFEIDEQFGSMEDLDKLTEDAKKRDINIVLELVLNYAADSHPFVSDEEKADWFEEVTVPAEDSTYWLDNVLSLDQENEEVQEYLLSVIDYWMDETDLAGFNLHAVDQMSPEFLGMVIDHVKEKDEEFYLYGTILEAEKAAGVIEQFGDDILIANTDLYGALLETFSDVGEPVSHIYDVWEDLGGKAAYMYVDDEHTKRFSQLVAEHGRNPTTAWKLLLTYMYTSPGVPVIFQGSEITMFGEGFPETQRLVPFHSAEQELEQFFYRIASLKEEFPSLSHGSYELLDSDGAMSVFKRSYEDETIYIAINNDDELRRVDITDVEDDKRLRGILDDNLARQNDDGSYSLGIPRESVEIYLIEDDIGFNWLFISFVVGIFLLFVAAVIYLSRKQKARES